VNLLIRASFALASERRTAAS